MCEGYVCMYVCNIYLVSALLRAFSGALMDCSIWNVKCHFPLLLNRCVLISFFEQLLFEHIAACIDVDSSFQALGPATENPRRCITVDRQRGTTKQNCSADRK